MSNSGLWIVIEGIDGAGKTSAIQTIQHVFFEYDLTPKILREPGGTALGEKIRELLKSSELKIIGNAEVLLLYAARLQLLDEVIVPNLDAGTHIILDRHELSTFAYQGGGRGVELDFIERISQVSMPERKPDLTLFLSLEPDVAFKRIKQRGELDHIEQQSVPFFQKVALSYEQLICQYPNVICVDANQEFDLVQQDIQAIVRNFLKNHLS